MVSEVWRRPRSMLASFLWIVFWFERW